MVEDERERREGVRVMGGMGRWVRGGRWGDEMERG